MATIGQWLLLFLGVCAVPAFLYLLFVNRALKNKVEASRRFMDELAHDLRTPLGSIKGFADTILRQKDMSEKDRLEFIGIIDEDADRLSRLVEKMIAWSRACSFKP